VEGYIKKKKATDVIKNNAKDFIKKKKDFRQTKKNSYQIK